jgi:hypothetical protein
MQCCVVLKCIYEPFEYVGVIVYGGSYVTFFWKQLQCVFFFNMQKLGFWDHFMIIVVLIN